ncbi:MAG: hypothetical protein KDI98_06900 [Hyphomicrobiaceae bacterium]|nr:hypothetical protein [Hyphomicrobiaceae bacterium]
MAGKDERIIKADGNKGETITAEKVAVIVDPDGAVRILIPETEMPLHPRAVAIVAAAMRLEDDDYVVELVGSLGD